MIPALPDMMIEPVVRMALAEDMGRAGDVTSQACVPADATLTVQFATRQAGVLAGMACARLAMAALDPEALFGAHAVDGDLLAPGQVLATVTGRARAILGAERTALNLISHLSGIATLTRAYVEAVVGTGTVITDTRKTTPGLRQLEKYAVRCGGARNHRFGLDDAILIKDNHVVACGGIAPALIAARAYAGHLMKVEIEVDSLVQLAEALPHRPDVIMLDNFSLADLRLAVKMAAGKGVLEASGGVTLATVRSIAETGVNVISVGALTHSAPILDIGLDAP